MKQKHLLSLLQSGMTTVEVAFSVGPNTAGHSLPPAPMGHEYAQPMPDPRGQKKGWGQPQRPEWAGDIKTYTYKAPAGQLKSGDHVVVERNDAFYIGLVVTVHDQPRIDTDADFDYKWIVQRVDREGYDANVEKERKFMQAVQEAEREHQRQQLVNKMMEHLPADSDARRMFDAAVAEYKDKTVMLEAPVASPAPSEPAQDNNLGMACK